MCLRLSGGSYERMARVKKSLALTASNGTKGEPSIKEGCELESVKRSRPLHSLGPLRALLRRLYVC